MADETRKIVHLVGTSAQGAAGGGRKGLLMHDTDAATLRMQLDAEGNYAFYARRDAAQTFTGVQTFQNGVVASTLKVTGQAGTGPRMVQAAADGTQSAVDAATARATLGAQAALGYTPVNKAGDTMTGALTLSAGNLNVGAGAIQTAGVTRISNGGAGTLTSLVNSATAGVGIRPKVALADGTDAVQDAATFRGTIGAVAASEKGAANGVAPLGADSKIASTYLPSYVDDVLEFASLAAFPATGETGKIYVTLDTNKTYRWSGSAYVEISASLALGETSSTAYRGDRGKTAYDHSQITAANPHGTTFAQLASKPTTLSGYGITDAQPLDADLTAIAGLSTQSFGRSLLTQADAAAVRTAIGASDGKELLNWYTPATRPADCDLTPDGLGGLRRFYAVAGIANGPSTTQSSHVLHIGHDNTGGYDTQLASELSTGALRSRAQTAGVWGAWRTFWDSVNLPASTTGKTLLNAADASAARSLIGAAASSDVQLLGTEYGYQTISFTAGYNSPISPIHTFPANFFTKDKVVKITGQINSGDLSTRSLKWLVDGSSSVPFYSAAVGEQSFLCEIYIKCVTAPAGGNVRLQLNGRITTEAGSRLTPQIYGDYAVASTHAVGLSVDNNGVSGGVGVNMWTVEQITKGA